MKIPVPKLAPPLPTEEVGYCRVSTEDQDPDFQVALMRKRGIPDDNIFVDVQSGRTMQRRELRYALKLMAGRKGWTLVVWKLDRLGRNALDLIQLAVEFIKNEHNLVSITENLDTRTPFGKFYFTLLAGLAQFESDTTAERVREGMARRRELGIHLGRRTRISQEQFKEMDRLLIKRPDMTIPEIAKKFKIAPSTVNHHFPGWRGKTLKERQSWRKSHPLPIKPNR